MYKCKHLIKFSVGGTFISGGARLFILKNIPGGMFIQWGTFIKESRVVVVVVFLKHKMSKNKKIWNNNASIIPPLANR